MPLRPPLPSVNYSSRDWESIRDSLLDYLRKKFPEDWTDFSESNLGIAMIEVVSYAFEVLSFSLDRAVNENFISTAQERQSVIKLAALVGYKLAGSTAASATVAIRPEELAKLTSPVFVSGGTRLMAGDVPFEVDRDYTIVKSGNSTLWSTNGQEPLEIAYLGVVQGQTVSESFTSTGDKFQILSTTKFPYIDKSSFVTVDGTSWTEVSSLVLGDPVDPANQNIYEILLDKDDKLSIKFGDGVTGGIPAEGSSIVVYQRTGGGARGNVAAGSLNSSISVLSNGQAATAKVTTNLPASGGTDRETTEHAKLYAPMWGRTTDRAITYDDYQAICNGYSDGRNGRISKAGIIAQPSDGLANIVTIYVWAEDGQGNLTEASEPLKNSLRAFLNSRRVLTVYISPIQNGVNVPIDLDILVSSHPGFSKAELTSQINTVLKTLFASPKVRYDNELRLSWIHDYLSAIIGVRSISIRDPNPSVVSGSLVDIESGVGLPSQVGASATEILITAPADRVANHYVNYEILVSSTGGVTEPHRVIASTAALSGNTVRLTVSSTVTSTVVQGSPYKFRHPRRVKISGVSFASEDLVKNRRLVLHQPIGGIDDVERSIVSYDIATNIAFVDRDYTSYPDPGTPAIVTADFMVSQTRAITLGIVNLEFEEAF